MILVFDGNKFASEIEERLRKKTSGTPRVLHSIVVGDEERAVKYQEMKKKAAKRVGCRLSVISYRQSVKRNIIIDKITKLNNDEEVHGIMIQLPLPDNLKPHTQELVNTIAPEKDVDGMRSDSKFTAPVVKAVVEVLRQSQNIVRLPLRGSPCTIVGADGFVGKKLVKRLNELGYKVQELDIGTKDFEERVKKADVVISATGVSDLIKPSMVKQGVVLIDVGAPKGDIAKSAYKKASFVSPVPGGVGPVTISMLMANLVES